MPIQLALSFDAVPGACEVQQRYHSIAPCLAGISTPAEQAQALNLGYSTVQVHIHARGFDPVNIHSSDEARGPSRLHDKAVQPAFVRRESCDHTEQVLSELGSALAQLVIQGEPTQMASL